MCRSRSAAKPTVQNIESQITSCPSSSDGEIFSVSGGESTLKSIVKVGKREVIIVADSNKLFGSSKWRSAAKSKGKYLLIGDSDPALRE